MEAAIATGIASTTGSVTGVFTTNLPVIFGVFGSLVGLGLIMRLVGRFIGRRA